MSLKNITRPQIVVANKYDSSLPEYNEHVMNLEKYCNENNIKLFFISAATGYNVKELVSFVATELDKLPPLTIYEADYVPEEFDDGSDFDELEITKDGKVYVCESEWLWRLVGRVNFSDRDSLNYFQRMLRINGIIDRLVEAGVKDGDTVRMYEFEFDFVN